MSHYPGCDEFYKAKDDDGTSNNEYFRHPTICTFFIYLYILDSQCKHSLLRYVALAALGSVRFSMAGGEMHSVCVCMYFDVVDVDVVGRELYSEAALVFHTPIPSCFHWV